MAEPERIENFRRLLLAWAENSLREYPWRFTKDPYAVLVAEFMLHRTQTRQVQPIYQRFMAAYPTLKDYASADPVEIRNLLPSLGLNWRVQAMIDALNQLWEKYHEVPIDYEKLTSIHGIGQYIGGAVVCFAGNQRVTLIDSNIVRVIGRVFGLRLKGEARRKKQMIQAISGVCHPTQPGLFYYSLIDLAHLICTPRNPKCEHCPLLAVPCVYGNRLD
jgi:A/G-specific adenine glycosylase